MIAEIEYDPIHLVSENNDILKIIHGYSKAVFAHKFNDVLKDVYFDEIYDDCEYISSYMFTRDLLEQLRSGMKAGYTHGYLYYYGGDGSAWGNMYDLLIKAYNHTTPKFEMIAASKDDPFEWEPEMGKEWLNANFESLCDMYEETQNKSEKPYYARQPDYWGDLSIFIECKSPEEHREAICWLEEFISTGEKLATQK